MCKFKLMGLIIILVWTCVSCSSGGETEKETVPEITSFLFVSDSGYSLLVDRDKKSVEITEPASLRGVVFMFGDTDSSVITSDVKIPLSAGACDGIRDWLRVAESQEKCESGIVAFTSGGANFEVTYENSAPSSVKITRGGLERKAEIKPPAA